MFLLHVVVVVATQCDYSYTSIKLTQCGTSNSSSLSSPINFPLVLSCVCPSSFSSSQFSFLAGPEPKKMNSKLNRKK